jgi:hypothetical protein
VLGDKTSIATAVTVQDPSAAGAIAAAEVATLSTDNGGIADIGSVTASISKSIALTNSLANRTSWIANVVTAAINQSTVGGTAISSTSNTINFLNKAAGAGANVGNLISEAVASDITSLVGFSSSNDSSALNTFLAATGKAAGGNTVYIAEGFAQYLTGVNPVTFATNVATASGTTSAAASIKAVVAEGVALADPSGAPAIATDVAATITDSAPANPNQAQAKLEDADNGLRATIAEDVAKAVPALAYDIAYDVGLQLDNTGSADASFATFTKGIISAVDGALPKPGLAAQLGAITSEVLLAASQNANALTETQVVNLIEAAATVKGGTAYEIVGAAIATVAATPALLADVGGNLTSFESVLLTAFNATNNSTTETEAANAKKTYGNNSDYFSVGSVTQPETGITNI